MLQSLARGAHTIACFLSPCGLVLCGGRWLKDFRGGKWIGMLHDRSWLRPTGRSSRPWVAVL